MRTMSKFGPAGARIGYMMGRKELIGEIEKVRPPYNVSVLNAEAALFALDMPTSSPARRRCCAASGPRLSAALAASRACRPSRVKPT
jgi:histidinol-phosphate aminotransferase